MSRLKRYGLAVVTSHAVAVAIGLHSLLSIPLVLRFLGDEGYGAWVLITQLVMYLWTVDSGLTPSVSRLLVDVKDDMAGGEYAAVVWTSALVQVVAAAATIGAVAAGLQFVDVHALFNIPQVWQAEFDSVLRWQLLLLLFMLSVRCLAQVLTAHQQQHVVFGAEVLFFGSNCLFLFLFLKAGAGLAALVLANAASFVLATALQAGACLRLRILPPRLRRGDLSRAVCGRVCRLAGDIFCTVLGSRLVLACQAFVLSSVAGIAAAGAWMIGTRLFFFLGQLVWRLFDASLPAFAEMMVRGESGRLRDRYRDLVRVTGVLTVLMAFALTGGNRWFLAVWVGRPAAWPVVADVLLSLWFLVLTAAHFHGVFILQTKQIGRLRYIYFAEGIAVVAGALGAVRGWGVAGMLVCSLVGSLCLHGCYVHHRMRNYFGIGWRELLLGWEREMVAAFVLLLVAAPCVARWPGAATGIGVAGIAWALFALRRVVGTLPDVRAWWRRGYTGG